MDAFAAVGSGDGFTYSAADPVRRIDAVFADPRLRPVSAEVIDSPDVRIASDHRPLLVDLISADPLTRQPAERRISSGQRRGCCNCQAR